eukprot:873490-Prymnesium_polylepis.1
MPLFFLVAGAVSSAELSGGAFLNAATGLLLPAVLVRCARRRHLSPASPDRPALMGTSHTTCPQVAHAPSLFPDGCPPLILGCGAHIPPFLVGFPLSFVWVAAASRPSSSTRAC